MEDLYAEYNFPSAQRFYAILRENGEPRTHKEVREFIEKQAVAQVLKKNMILLVISKSQFLQCLQIQTTKLI